MLLSPFLLNDTTYDCFLDNTFAIKNNHVGCHAGRQTAPLRLSYHARGVRRRELYRTS
jgi:hypothetical protein